MNAPIGLAPCLPNRMTLWLSKGTLTFLRLPFGVSTSYPATSASGFPAYWHEKWPTTKSHVKNAIR